MNETLFERYKEALRAGHVAVVRGRLEDALAAYRSAVEIAPDRAVPHAALGGVHLRMGDPAAALAAYDAALELAPDDDPATLGRAQALVVLRRTAEAAATYDHLADLRASGRPPEAAEAARRALAIEPTDRRRERHASLAAAARGGAAAAYDEELAAVTAGGGAEAEPIPPAIDPEALVLAAEEAAARGDPAAAAAAALEAGRAHRAAGHAAAAFDACLRGLESRPADPDIHLLLAELAIDRGWAGQARDTYRDLLRLAELDGNADIADRVRAVALATLPDDPRFAAS